MKRIFFVLLSVCTAFSCGCSLLEPVEPKRPVSKDDLQPKYSLIDESRVTSPKYSKSMSDVPFAVVAAAESNIITQGYGKADNTDLSESHLCYYSRTDEQKASLGTEAVLYTSDSSLEAFINAMSDGVGLEKEENVPLKNGSIQDSVDEVRKLEKSGAVSEHTGEYLLTDCSNVSTLSRDELKLKIFEDGAVYADAYVADGSVKSCGEDMVLCSFSENSSSPNHAFNIVGWDDDYPKENFSQGVKAPSSDGAWLCRTYEEGFADKNGCIYVSYENTPFVNMYALDMSNYGYGSSILSYTDHICRDGVKTENGSTDAACVFTGASGDINAAAVVTLHDKQKIRIRVYKDPDKGTPDSGQLITDIERTVSCRGYHAVDIDATAHIEKNDTVSVVVTYENDGDADSSYGRVPFEGVSSGALSADIGSGESYIFDGDGWHDTGEADTSELFSKSSLGHFCVKLLLTK